MICVTLKMATLQTTAKGIENRKQSSSTLLFPKVVRPILVKCCYSFYQSIALKIRKCTKCLPEINWKKLQLHRKYWFHNFSTQSEHFKSSS